MGGQASFEAEAFWGESSFQSELFWGETGPENIRNFNSSRDENLSFPTNDLIVGKTHLS